MTRAELRDMRLRAIRGLPLTEREQLGVIDACDRLVAVVAEWAGSNGDVSPYHHADVGREAVNITQEVKLS